MTIAIETENDRMICHHHHQCPSPIGKEYRPYDTISSYMITYLFASQEVFFRLWVCLLAETITIKNLPDTGHDDSDPSCICRHLSYALYDECQGDRSSSLDEDIFTDGIFSYKRSSSSNDIDPSEYDARAIPREVLLVS